MSEDKLPQEYYLQSEDVWKDFVHQLKKDAQMSSIELKDEIFQSKQLSEIIQHFNNELQNIISETNGFEKIQSWLYRVDVSEKSIKSKLNQNTNYTQIIAELIVKRTLQKVIIKYLHKSNKL